MRHSLVVSLAASFAVALSACSDPATGPRPGGPALAFSLAVSGGPAEAFDRADRLAVTVVTPARTRPGPGPVLDTVMPFSSGGGDVRLRLRLPSDPGDDPVSITVELRLGGAPLFRGGAEGVTFSASSEPVDITLEPVITRILGPPEPPTIVGIGNTLQLTAAAVMATDDTVPGIPLAWTAIDANIVTTNGTGLARGLSDGDGRVEVRYGGVATVVTVRVRAIVASVLVTPPEASLPVGGTQQFSFTARDQAGNVLVRTATWSSTNDAIISIDAAGLASAKALGTAAIQAVVEGITGSALVTVRPPTPNAPTNLEANPSGATVRLAWTDNATDETSYEVFRGPPGATQPALIATLGPNATTYSDAAGFDSGLLEYQVSACNAAGCSAPALVTTRTVPAAPSSLVGDLSSMGELRLSWKDNSATEDRFEIEVNYDYYLFEPWESHDDTPANTVDYYDPGFGFEFAWVRVRACNDAGCSGPSNEIMTYACCSPSSAPPPSAGFRVFSGAAVRTAFPPSSTHRGRIRP